MTSKLLVQKDVAKTGPQQKEDLSIRHLRAEILAALSGPWLAAQYEVDIPIPRTRPPSSKSYANEIQWSLILEIDIPHGSDDVQTFP